MHYDYHDFKHAMTDAERSAWLREQYETVMAKVAEGSGRKIIRLMKFLRESDFYSVPCRHHPFAGGNAWHQLETFAYALSDTCPSAPLAEPFGRWQPEWSQLDKMSLAVACLLHDVCNAGYGGAVKVNYPDRIRPRHGRKSTFVLVDYLKFDLMFDENMAIIHHTHKDEETLRLKTPTEQDYDNIMAMPLYHMMCLCDTLSCTCRMTEQELKARLADTIAKL